MAGVRIGINTDACVGVGLCEGLEPELVEVVDGIARVLSSRPIPVEQARELCAVCPTGALHIVGPDEADSTPRQSE
jgi:ferredoxin